MKILAIACSPRKGKTTRSALEAALTAAGQAVEGVETELVELAELEVRPCTACGACREKLECPQDDDFGELIPKLSDPNLGGIIIGTPVYFGSVTGQCKSLLDRCVMFRRNGFMFRDKVGGALAVGGVRNGGQEYALSTIHAAMFCQGMVVVADSPPTAHFGGVLVSDKKTGVDQDETGLETARNVGWRVAEVAARLAKN